MTCSWLWSCSWSSSRWSLLWSPWRRKTCLMVSYWVVSSLLNDKNISRAVARATIYVPPSLLLEAAQTSFGQNHPWDGEEIRKKRKTWIWLAWRLTGSWKETEFCKSVCGGICKHWLLNISGRQIKTPGLCPLIFRAKLWHLSPWLMQSHDNMVPSYCYNQAR